MADYKIFSIGSVDYTPLIKSPDYSVASEDVTETWVDGNHINHIHIVRTRISGSVHLVLTKTQYLQLLADLETAKIQPGIYSLGVHVNNRTAATELTQISAYVSIDTGVVYGTKGYRYAPYGMDVVLNLEEI